MNAALVFSSAFETSGGKRRIRPEKMSWPAKLAHPKCLAYIPAIGIQAPRRMKEQ
ncbi:hypothetical protein [Mesorhizobium sp.]|uniref:hypothetical protein n=1 Tax=Mesorhizobium sp. TaxID=1871066 RepID=UPI0025E5975B|nr:hypothetical protein [Mesorhizobium sp.]